MGSFLQARTQGGQWLLRIEDLDPPRTVEGAADNILRTLERYGFEWEGAVVYQSQRLPLYEEALQTLQASNAVYPCSCSRREIAEAAHSGPEGPIYPGTCRLRPARKRAQYAMRVRTGTSAIRFSDLVQGANQQAIAGTSGDFVVRRADRLVAYQLAVVVDDAEQGISQVVRGADLLSSTPRQIHLQRLLGLQTPEYGHLPLAVDDRGNKLSKQTGAHPLALEEPVPVLVDAFAFLGQPLPPERPLDPEEFWSWALASWHLSSVPRQLTLPHGSPDKGAAKDGARTPSSLGKR